MVLIFKAFQFLEHCVCVCVCHSWRAKQWNHVVRSLMSSAAVIMAGHKCKKCRNLQMFSYNKICVYLYNVFFNSFPYSTRFFWIGIWSQDCPKNFWYLRQKQSLFRAIFSFSFSPQCSHLLSNKDACIEFANIANVAHAWILVDKIIYRIRSNKSLCRGAT